MTLLTEEKSVDASSQAQWSHFPTSGTTATLELPGLGEGRHKRPHKKVRSGCLTCKKRRVKCDEGKPICRRCSEADIGCSGYATPKTWLFQPKEPAMHKETGSLEAAPSWLSSLGDPKNLRAFQFFIEKTAPLFSAYLGHSFWTFHLPRVGLTFPAVKHVLLASSSLVENEVCRSVSMHDHVFARHYGEAVKLLTQESFSVGTESVLASALLFATCDFMEGDFAAGIRHLQSGVHILDEWFKVASEKAELTTNNSLLITTIIAPIFASYNEKFPTYGLSPLQYRKEMYFFKPCPDLPKMPSAFISLVEARHCLDGISHHVVKAMERRLKSTLADDMCTQLRASLKSWQESFDGVLLQMPAEQREQTARSTTLLQIHAKVLFINSTSALIPLDLIYKESYYLYVSILQSYTDLSVLPNWAGALKCLTGKRAEGELSWHLGFVPPLYFTATTCPDRSLREAALFQLASLDIIESNWNSCVASTIAKTISDLMDSCVTLNSQTSERSEVFYVEDVRRQSDGKLSIAIRGFHSESLAIRKVSCTGCDCTRKMVPVLGRQLFTGGYQGATRPTPLNCKLALSQEFPG